MNIAMFSRFKLATKFTVFLSLVFVGAIAVSGIVLSQALERKAEAEIAYRGQVLAETMNSVRNFTNTHVSPLLMPLVNSQPTFVPEAIPSYTVREVFESLRKNDEYKEFFYKDALLNPTNLRDKADIFEAELVDRFRKQPGLKNISGFRDSVGDEKLFYSARPFSIKNPTCLQCHSTPEAAPKSHIVSYGSENGFGWTLNEILGTQVIYVPASAVFDDASRAFFLFISIFIAIFALVILFINYLLKRNVLQPIKPMAQLAQKISMDEISAEAAAVEHEKLAPIAKRNDELGQLGRIFQRMVHEIYAREQQLRQQLNKLRLEIDDAKRARQVAEIAESETFQQLQEEAKAMRNKWNTDNE